jgi:MFS family permease
MPAGVWVLGSVSLLMDVSSEMIHSVLPLFLVGTLHLSALAVGAVEGLAESVALMVKVFSGVLSDKWGRRKPLVLAGYGMSAMTKPLFALAQGLGWVVGARLVDRVGKGIRGAPRDALLTDITPARVRGEAFGLRQSLDTLGALLGPLAALGLLLWAEVSYRAIFWWATLPAIAAVVLLWLGVREPASSSQNAPPPLVLRGMLQRLPGAYWRLLLLAAVLGLARFSEAFLLLRAENVGLASSWVPGVLLLMSLFYALTAYPVGWASDRLDRRIFLAAGLAVLILADVALALADGPLMVAIGAGLWGVHLGLTQGTLNALVADVVPGPLRGTGFGLLNWTMGLALLLASVSAGALWTYTGPMWTFWAGSVWAALAGLVLYLGHRGVRTN